MPLSQAQPDALAHTYARSFFELARDAGGQPKIEECLGELEDILEIARGDARFAEFLSSRVLPASSRAASMKSIFEGRVSDLTLRFLQVLNEKERLSHLPAIVAALDQIAQESFGRIEVDVYTAAPISGDELNAVRSRLSDILSKEVVVHPYTDASMIGGVKLRIGDQLVDGSVATRLRKMRQRFTTSGAAEVRARAADILDNGEG